MSTVLLHNTATIDENNKSNYSKNIKNQYVCQPESNISKKINNEKHESIDMNKVSEFNINSPTTASEVHDTGKTPESTYSDISNISQMQKDKKRPSDILNNNLVDQFKNEIRSTTINNTHFLNHKVTVCCESDNNLYSDRLLNYNSKNSKIEPNLSSGIIIDEYNIDNHDHICQDIRDNCNYSDSRIAQAEMSEAVAVIVFSVYCETNFGERLVLVGSKYWLGNWDLSSGIEMEWNDGHIWVVTVRAPLLDVPSTEFKYVKINESGFNWENRENRVMILGPMKQAIFGV